MSRSLWDQGLFGCVGLDIDHESIPRILNGCKSLVVISRLSFFVTCIVQATNDLVCSFKPNLAFYLAEGRDGLCLVEEVIGAIKKDGKDRRGKSIPIILDGKFGDVDSTNEKYAHFAYRVCGADAVTVSPYLGGKPLEPFIRDPDKGVFALCRTSNPGADELQDKRVEVSDEELRLLLESKSVPAEVVETWDALEKPGKPVRYLIPLYQYWALMVHKIWNKNGNCGLVTGATNPVQLRLTRALAGDMPLLIPGIGKQAGELDASVRGGLNSKGQGIIVNSSRGVITTPYKGSDFADAIPSRNEMIGLADSIRQVIKLANGHDHAIEATWTELGREDKNNSCVAASLQ